MQRLAGKRAAVLGATSILGSAMAAGLKEAGAELALVGRSPKKLEELGLRLDSPTFLADAADPKSLEDLRHRLGDFQILLNAIGGNQPGATLLPDEDLFGLDPKALQEVVGLNLMSGGMLSTLVLGKTLAESGRPGSVLIVGSVSAELPLTRVGGYAAAKAGLTNFARWAAVEFGQRTEGRVRVNVIQPGFFLTDQNRALLVQPDGHPTERGRKILEHTPHGRFGDPEDLKGAAVWLASDESKFVTGAVIPVDGGFTAWWGV